MKKWEFVEYLNLVSPRIKSRLPVGRQVSRFLLLISPVTLETSFLNSTFKIQRSAFDIILIFVAPRYMMRTIITRLLLNVQLRLKNEEVGIRGIFESRIATKVSFLVSRF